MKDHPAQRQSSEVVHVDHGGWISGPSASIEPVPADQIEQGDFLQLEDGTRAEVTDVRYGYYWLPGGRQQGVSIGWKLGNSSGLLFRKASDTVKRLANGA
jgi:hypothetical protein